MVNFINHSAFPALQYSGQDQYDIDFNIVVSRITYDINIKEKNGHAILVQSEEQSPLNYIDAHYQNDAHGSIEYESDLAPYKPKTDVVIKATAFAPPGEPVSFFDVAVEIGGIVKQLRITGSRCWKFSLLGWTLGYPDPIDKLDILYQYASGGFYNVDGQIFASPHNPLGMGWYPEKYLKLCQQTTLPAPQIESVERPIQKIAEYVFPEGFGFFGRSWRGRIEYAGTYDDAWLENRHPYLPQDFNFKYWCGAHPSLQIDHPKLLKSIPVMLSGLVAPDEIPNQRISFSIPVETLFVFVKTELGFCITHDMVLDTIVIDMQSRKIYCTYRITLAESLKIFETQLRHIATTDREKQIELSKTMQREKSSMFVPLPPSLLKRGDKYG